MADSYTVEEFAMAINEALQEFAGAVDYDVWYVTEKVAKQAAANVREGIKSSGIKGTGAYRKSIRVRSLKEKRLVHTKIVYAKAPEYRLTHLLEYGHATANGGRTRAFTHWKPAEQKAIDDFVKELREAINDH